MENFDLNNAFNLEYFRVVFNDNNEGVYKNPVLRNNNVLEAETVSLDHINDDGFVVFIDFSKVSLLESISRERLDFMRMINIRKIQYNDVSTLIDIKESYDKASRVGINVVDNQQRQPSPPNIIPENPIPQPEE